MDNPDILDIIYDYKKEIEIFEEHKKKFKPTLFRIKHNRKIKILKKMKSFFVFHFETILILILSTIQIIMLIYIILTIYLR